MIVIIREEDKDSMPYRKLQDGGILVVTGVIQPRLKGGNSEKTIQR